MNKIFFKKMYLNLECIEEILQRQRKGTWEEGENERVMGK
jgi:hypothetical protein